MARHLLNLSIDCSMIFEVDRLVFTYEDVTFLYRSRFSNLYGDGLTAIVDDTESAKTEAVRKAVDWANALSFNCHGYATVSLAGGGPVDDSTTLSGIYGHDLAFRTGPRGHRSLGHGINVISDIQTSEQRRALQIYNLGMSAGDRYSAFLFFWQVLDVKQKAKQSKYPPEVDWIDSLPPKFFRPVENDVCNLKLGTTCLGQYLFDNARSAVAHLRREPGRGVELDFASLSDALRMGHCVRIARHLAEHKIRADFNLTQRRYLVDLPGQPIPRYLGIEDTLDQQGRDSQLPKPSAEVRSAIERMVSETDFFGQS